MALINCSECGKEFSNNAPACPNCGQPTSFNYINKDKSKPDESSGNIKDDKKEKEVSNDKANIDEKSNESTDEKSYGGIVVIVVVILLALFFFGNSHMQINKAIELVDNYPITQAGYAPKYDTLGEEARGMAKSDINIERIYGWEAERVAGKTYFVAFAFDYDIIKGNGYVIYCYEVNLNGGMVRKITGNHSLEEKYEEMGYISSE